MEKLVQEKTKPRIKICGMRDPANILEIGELQPDYMGFIAYPLSKRHLATKPITLDALPKSIKRVGVFVNQSIENILEYADCFDLDVVQLHGDESPEIGYTLKKEGYEVWKAFGLSNDFNFDTLIPYLDSTCTDAFLYDTKSDTYGGSGRQFNREILHKLPFKKPFWLSGGLAPEDLKEWELRNTHPSLIGLDLNSRFEVSPGLKNHKLLVETLKIYRAL